MGMKKLLLVTVSSIMLLLCLSVMPAFADNSGLDEVPVPIDPQNWVLHRDMTWDDFKPNPVIDWMAEFNDESIQRPSFLLDANAKKPIRGGLIMIEYLDRKFISRGEAGSDLMGFHMYKEDGTGMEDKITNNPIVSGTQMVADQKYDGDISKVTDADFSQWWADYLNVPQEINNYATINEYYRENSYGKWSIDVIPYGPFTIPYFEFETMGYDINSSFQTYRDIPPSFRYGDPEVATEAQMRTYNSSTNTSQNPYASVNLGRRFDSIAIPFARESGVPFVELDFFFMLHAGYDESGVWQQFGMFQYPSRKAIPEQLGPKSRMLAVEKFFTENPDYLNIYITRYAGQLGEATFKQNKDNYDALVAAGTPEKFEFKLSQADWDWVASYNDITTRNTRYVAYTSWEAAVGEWSHMATANTSLTGAGRTIRYSTQGENDGMGTFAHEFGHIGELPDNYQLAWTVTNSPLTEPWEVMSRGQLGGPFDYHTRWQVPGVQGGTVPTNMTMRNKIVTKYFDAKENNYSNTVVANGAEANDLLEMRVQDLAASTPLVAEVVARNIPLNNNGLYPQLNKYGLYSPNFYKGIHLTFGNAASGFNDKATRVQTGWTWTYTAAANWMGVEVVDMNGYDSFAPSSGVLLTRMANESTGTGTSFTWNVIDSHLYDIGLVDYENNGDYVAHTLGQGYHLWDGAFHAGKSTVDTGYYRSEYDPEDPNYNQATPRLLDTTTYEVLWKKAMIKPGSIARWEERGGREIASGDTVNEFHDAANDLHFYILAKNMHDGRTLPGNTEPEQFLSYTIGILHGKGTPVDGDLKVVAGEIQPAVQGKVAVANFEITNTGTATDIVRVAIGFNTDYKVLDATLLNDLYAIDAGETITVPVYCDIPYAWDASALPGFEIIFSATSESNKEKRGTATINTMGLEAHSVRFYAADKTNLLDTLYVGHGSAINLDEVPMFNADGTKAITEWSTEDGIFDLGTVINQPIILFASREAAAYTITFLGTDGETVLATQFVADGGLVNMAKAPKVEAGHGNQLKGWLIQESGNPFNKETEIHQNYNLMPWIAKAHLQLTTEANNVKAGDKFDLHAYFTETTESNTAILDFAFDTKNFVCEGFTPADGVTLVSVEPIVGKGVRVTVMILDYETTDFGFLNMAAKADADLEDENNEITVTANYVVRLANGSKEVVQETASTIFGTTYDKDWDGKTYSLIYLSNMIDVFGMTSADPQWKKYSMYDLVVDGQIDIMDVAYFAERIVL